MSRLSHRLVLKKTRLTNKSTDLEIYLNKSGRFGFWVYSNNTRSYEKYRLRFSLLIRQISAIFVQSILLVRQLSMWYDLTWQQWNKTFITGRKFILNLMDKISDIIYKNESRNVCITRHGMITVYMFLKHDCLHCFGDRMYRYIQIFGNKSCRHQNYSLSMNTYFWGWLY